MPAVLQMHAVPRDSGRLLPFHSAARQQRRHSSCRLRQSIAPSQQVFRNAHHAPSKTRKFTTDPAVPRLIGPNLPQPRLTHVLRHPCTFWTTVPKTSVHEYNYTSRGKYHVRMSRQPPTRKFAITDIRQVPKSLMPKSRSQCLLRTSTPTIVGHCFLTLGSRHYVTTAHHSPRRQTPKESEALPGVRGPCLESLRGLALCHLVQLPTTYARYFQPYRWTQRRPRCED